MKELKKILCAEDEPDIQVIMQTVFESFADYESKFCQNGQEVLDCVEDYKPDLVILDVMMPKLDGLSTYAKLQEMPSIKDTPVIFITAKAQAHEVETFEGTGALGIIIKPFDPLKLCDEIEKIWESQFKD